MPTVPSAVSTHPVETSEFEEKTYRKVVRRLLPVLLLCYVVAYLDRVNVGFAKLQMLDDLGLSDTMYAIGASVFFWGYFIFEIPSNVFLHRYGARFWIARIMFTWGLVSMALAFVEPLARLAHVETATMFYTLRFLLGICEAGFFPGVILYLNYWFPAQRQSRVMSGFLIAMPVSLMLGGVVSGWFMEHTAGLFGYQGWQWMLLLEGVPSLLTAFVVYFSLDDGIEHANWLTAEEKTLLAANLNRESTQKTARFGSAVRDPRVWLLVAILLTFNTGFYGLAFWLPSIIKATGVQDPLHIGLLTAFVVYFSLDDGIERARWLTAEEKALLAANLNRESTQKTARFGSAVRDPRVWLLVAILLTFNTGFYGLAFWLPSIIKATGVQDPLHIGLLTAIPYGVAIIATLANAAHSKKTGERRLHAAIPALIGGIGLILSAAFAHQVVLAITFLTIATAGILALMPIYWTFPGQLLSGAAAAAGIAMINAIGNLSGFTGSMITAVAKNLTGDINNGTYALGACLLVSCVLILLVPRSMLARPPVADGKSARQAARATT